MEESLETETMKMDGLINDPRLTIPQPAEVIRVEFVSTGSIKYNIAYKNMILHYFSDDRRSLLK